MAPRGGSFDHLVGPGGTSALSEEFYRQIIGFHKKRKLEDPVLEKKIFLILASN